MGYCPFIELLATASNSICRRCHSQLLSGRTEECLDCGAPRFPISDPLDDYFIQLTLSLDGTGTGLGALLDFQSRKNLRLIDLKAIQAHSALDGFLQTTSLIGLYRALCPLSRDAENLASKQLLPMAISVSASADTAEDQKLEETWLKFRETIVRPVNEYVANTLARYQCIALEIDYLRDQLLLYSDLKHLHQCQVQTDIITSLSNHEYIPALEKYLTHSAIELGKLAPDAPPLKRLLYIEALAYNPNLRVTARRIRLQCHRLSRRGLDEELKTHDLTPSHDNQTPVGPISLHESTFYLEWLCQLLSPKADRPFMVKKGDLGAWLPKARIRNLLNACPHASPDLKKWIDVANQSSTVSPALQNITPFLEGVPLMESWNDPYLQNEASELLTEYRALFTFFRSSSENTTSRVTRVEVKTTSTFVEELRVFVEEICFRQRTDPRALGSTAKNFLLCAISLCFYFQSPDWTFDFLERLRVLALDLHLEPAELFKTLGEFDLFWERDESSFERWVFHQKSRKTPNPAWDSEMICWVFFGGYATRAAKRTIHVSEETLSALFTSLLMGPAYRAHTLDTFMILLKWQAVDHGSLKAIAAVLLAPRFWQLVLEHSNRRDHLKFLADGLQRWHHQFSSSSTSEAPASPSLQKEWTALVAEVSRTAPLERLHSISALRSVLQQIFPTLGSEKKSPSATETHPNSASTSTEALRAQKELESKIKDEAQKARSEQAALQVQLTLQTVEALNAQRKAEFEARSAEFLQKMQEAVKNQNFDQIPILTSEKDRDLAAIQKKYDELILQVQKSLNRG